MVGLIASNLFPVQLFQNCCHFSEINIVTRGKRSVAGIFMGVTGWLRLGLGLRLVLKGSGLGLVSNRRVRRCMGMENSACRVYLSVRDGN